MKIEIKFLFLEKKIYNSNEKKFLSCFNKISSILYLFLLFITKSILN